MSGPDTRTEEVVELLRQRAENYYDAHGLCCSEAILQVVNRAFGGGLSDGQVRRLGSGFCGGMGGGDGVCGALSGAVTALGLILGPGQPLGLSKGRLRRAAKALHDAFLARLSSTCCRELIAPFAGNRRGRMKNCQRLTGIGAELCGRILLDLRPELLDSFDQGFAARKDSRWSAWLQRLRAVL